MSKKSKVGRLVPVKILYKFNCLYKNIHINTYQVGRERFGVWDGHFKLLYLEQITNKNLLYGAESSDRYSVIT